MPSARPTVAAELQGLLRAIANGKINPDAVVIVYRQGDQFGLSTNVDAPRGELIQTAIELLSDALRVEATGAASRKPPVTAIVRG